MATHPTAFCSESAKIHEEHRILLQELAALNSALDRLVCYSEVYANLASAGEVRCYGLRLAERLPGHFEREEATLLATVREISPELAEFAREMTREHQQLRERLASFRLELDNLDALGDLDEAICHLKEQGKELTRELGRHIALEEQELNGFL